MVCIRIPFISIKHSRSTRPLAFVMSVHVSAISTSLMAPSPSDTKNCVSLLGMDIRNEYVHCLWLQSLLKCLPRSPWPNNYLAILSPQTKCVGGDSACPLNTVHDVNDLIWLWEIDLESKHMSWDNCLSFANTLTPPLKQTLAYRPLRLNKRSRPIILSL